MNLIERLHSKNLVHPPGFVVGGTKYLTIMGSVAYGVSGDTSDMDLYGFCIPPKSIVFPHTAGYIPGFSTQVPNFDQWQEHHIKETDTRKEYDFNVYSIIKYFKLVMENNPNMIDSLFTAPNMVITSTKISDMVRDQRKMFLHKGAWHKFKGYAYGQVQKMKIKEPDQTSVRYEMVQKYGYDVKFAYHVVRLLDEVEQILTEGDIDLMRNREQLKSIRRGDWKIEEIEEHFVRREKELQTLYTTSKLPDRPDEPSIAKLLLNCLEEHYGSLDEMIKVQDPTVDILRQIKKLVEGI